MSDSTLVVQVALSGSISLSSLWRTAAGHREASLASIKKVNICSAHEHTFNWFVRLIIKLETQTKTSFLATSWKVSALNQISF